MEEYHGYGAERGAPELCAEDAIDEWLDCEGSEEPESRTEVYHV